jgi:hypothetical protein
MDAHVFAGLVLSSHDPNKKATATFDHLAFTNK